MKKLVRILSLCLATLMLLTALVSCGAPAKDPDKAVAALEEAEFSATKDTKIQPAALALLGYKVDAVVSGSKSTTNDDGDLIIDYVIIYYFTDKENAKKAMTEIEKLANEDKEAKDSTDSKWVAPTRSGSIVYYGTKAAVKAAK